MIITTITADGNTTIDERAHSAAFAVHGTWGGATIKLQGKVNGSSTWFDITDASWTADATGVVDISPAWAIRVNTSSVTTTSVEVSLQKRSF
jgi:hypothetical protein